jgi:pre-rRNA-processing protein TSR1
LDIAKVADLIVFVMDVNEGVDDAGHQIVHLLNSQGMPTVMGAVIGSADVQMKKRHDTKKACMESLAAKFAEEPRIVPCDNMADADQLIRFIVGQKIRDLWRDRRSYMLVEGVSFTSTEEEFGVLSLSGYIRGGELDVNGLIHLSGYGDFQIERVDGPRDPHPYLAGRRTEAVGDADIILGTPNLSEQTSLEACNTPDDMANEQTWPTDEELAAALKKKKVPKGTSAYQAAWIAEAFASDDDDDDDESGGSCTVVTLLAPNAYKRF